MKKNFRYVGHPTPRIDGRDKVTGITLYPTDRYLEGMLHGKTLWSGIPHGEIISLNVDAARRLPGVEAVLTWKDVPGHNGFGIIGDNWPVLCQDRVRFRGDAIAIVAAVDEETAERAVSLIEVEYRPLPIVTTTAEALTHGAVRLHEQGNIMHSLSLSQGDIKDGMAAADLFRQSSFSTQCMEHAYLETEGGVAVYDEIEGIITIWCGNQYTFRDQLQIARALDWDPSRIRVIGSPAGGSFGSKDEISIQIHAALLALRTKKPVRMHWSRKESIVVSPKRHAFESTVGIGVRQDGTFTAMDLDLTADTGPYDTIAPAVLNLALESAPGPYRFPNGRFEGIAVYTNNAVGGEFRGFGNPQVTFPREILIDELAEELGMDPIELRLRNALEQGDRHGLGFIVQGSVGFRETLLAAREHYLWRERERITSELNERFPGKKHGVGVASTAQAVGLGAGIPDYANVEIELLEGGGLNLRTGASEIGQGNLTAYAQILAEALGCDIERISVIHGDTFLTPDSGSVTSSRSVHIVGNAILNAVANLIRQLISERSGQLGIPEDDLDYNAGRITDQHDQSPAVTLAELANRVAAAGRTIQVTGKAVMRTANADLGVGMAHVYYSFITQLVLLGVDPGTGEVEIIEVVSLPEIGRAINRAGVEGQCEGGVVMGQGYALLEEVIVEDGDFKNPGFSTYIIPTALDVPVHTTIIVDKPDEHSPFGAKGVGEIPTVTVAPAVANALYAALGIRFRTLPITPEMIKREIKEVGQVIDSKLISDRRSRTT